MGKRKKSGRGAAAFFALFLFSWVSAGCGSAGEASAEAPEEGLPAPETGGADSNYLFAGVSAVTVKPGSVRTVAVSFNSEEPVDEAAYVWVSSDPSVAAVRGMGSKCAVMGKREGSAVVAASHPGVPMPYAFRVVCAADGAAEKKFRRTGGGRTEGRLVGGWSNLELAESWGNNHLP